jgi:hypothetical protein
MKVKIVKAKDCWYRDKVGEIFEVKPYMGNTYRLTEEGNFKGCCIDVEHAELITPIKIPFTFEAWDKDRTQKVWTRDGREVKQLTFFENAKDDYRLVGVADIHVKKWTPEGIGIIGETTAFDLFLEHHEREYWVNVYEGEAGIFLGSICKSEKEVNCTSCPGYKLIKKISFKA